LLFILDGGISELAEDLNSSKVMYGFCKVKDPKTSLPKFVLINWVIIINNFLLCNYQLSCCKNIYFYFLLQQGESCPALRKGTCANHLGAIQTFFKGIHVMVNARIEEEVDEEAIVEKVAKASGSTYNFNRSESKDEGQQRPVVFSPFIT